MNKTELKEVWTKFGLSCRNNYTPEIMRKFYAEIGLKFPEKFVYTEPRYREWQFKAGPRVDAEDVLVHVCKHFKIQPDEKHMEIANQMMGEGSRRQKVEEAYLSDEIIQVP